MFKRRLTFYGPDYDKCHVHVIRKMLYSILFYVNIKINEYLNVPVSLCFDLTAIFSISHNKTIQNYN